jgi:mannose-6-phosphate isomerase-like protein (cupin superfamily)
MKRMTPVLLLCVGYLAGLATIPHVTVVAQDQNMQGQGAQPAAPQAVDGKGMYFSSEYIKKMFPTADKNGKLPSSTISNHLAWDPSYRFTIMRRQHYGQPQKDPRSGEMILYSDAEMHENKTQIYIMVGGVGAVELGGKPEKEPPGPYYDGQHDAPILEGAMSYRVKPGDVFVIPPRTWHRAVPDPGETLTYEMCHIETPRLMP